MGYAIRNDGQGWRAVDGPDDVTSDETFSESQPAPIAISMVPRSVTMRQARMALLKAGKLDAVNAAIAAIPGEAGQAARIEWEFSSTVERNRDFVSQIAVGINMTDKQLDDLFILAATL